MVTCAVTAEVTLPFDALTLNAARSPETPTGGSQRSFWPADRLRCATAAVAAVDTVTHAVPLHFCSVPELTAWITSDGEAVSASATLSVERRVSYVIS